MKCNYDTINYSWQVKCIGLHRKLRYFQLISGYTRDKHVRILSFAKWWWWPLKAVISFVETCFCSGEPLLAKLQLLINGGDSL